MPTTAYITITGHFAVDTLLSFKITECLNNHSTLTYSGIVNDANIDEVTKKLSSKDGITASVMSKTVFGGIPLSAEIKRKNDFFILTVQCISHSYQLDIIPTSCSFQDTSLTHKQVLGKLYSDNKIGAVLVRDVTDSKIGYPIIKYDETDWQFSLRMAARINSVLYPNTIGDSADVYVGVHPSSDQLELPNDYHEGYNTALYLHQKELFKDIMLSDYCFVKFKKDPFSALGQRLQINGQEYFICEKSVELISDLVETTYTVSSIYPYIRTIKTDDKLAGLSLMGTVIDTQGELIKLHLDIDESQDKGTAYWFDYKPAVGNVFHVMPQHGTTALLHLNRNTGKSGQVTHVIHKNADDVSEMADYNRRYFTTEFKKRLAMLPELLDFKNKDTGHHLELKDSKGITMATTKRFVISAEEDVVMHSAGHTSFYTPEKVYITKVGTDGVIEMSGGDIHIKSKESKLISRSKRTLMKTRSTPKLPPMEVSGAFVKKTNSLVPKVIRSTGSGQ